MNRTLALVGVLWGCGGVSVPAEYADALATAECNQLERCELGRFDSEYSSPEDCVRERSNNIDDALDALEDLDCDFDVDEANRCVRRVSGLSCEEWVEGDGREACDLVYYCESFSTYIPVTSTFEG